MVTWERDIYLDVQTCEVCYPECSEWFQFYTVQWEGYYKKCDGQAVCYSCAADEAGCCFWPGGDDPCYTTPPPP
ncbi:MAG: hypothetical protein HXY24_18935 [Rubrivivax sp.]|nr:hypothetical protein [Rubrivivax sp.]